MSLAAPPTTADVQSGYGTRLIRELVPYELAGMVDLKLAAAGLNCKTAIARVEKSGPPEN